MSPESQRIAIAEACGWVKVWRNISDKETQIWVNGHQYALTANDLPDYLNDLNAMHEAEKVLKKEWVMFRYTDILKEIVPLTDWFVRATAAQRAEAFLKTLNLWEDAV